MSYDVESGNTFSILRYPKKLFLIYRPNLFIFKCYVDLFDSKVWAYK